MVVAINGSGVKSITDTDIVAAIQKQLGFAVSSGFQLAFRLYRIRVYQEVPRDTAKAQPTPLKAPFTVAIWPAYSEAPISIQSDWAGSETRYARIGYHMPHAQTVIPLTGSVKTVLLRVTPTDTDDSWLAMFDISWSTTEETAESSEEPLRVHGRDGSWTVI